VKTNLKIGFIGSGDWGAVFFQVLNNHKNIFVENILTLNYLTNRLVNINCFPNVIYYDHKHDYKLFSNKLDAVIMAGWPYKIPEEVLKYYSFPVINIHASLLPKYRGPEPIIQQILNDEKVGGVTIHRINTDWDDGDVCEQIQFSITETDNNRTLFLKSSRAGKKVLEEVIHDLSSERLSFIPQSSEMASYYPKIDITKYIINSKNSMNDIQNYMRAFVGAYPLLTYYHDKLVILKKILLTKEDIYSEGKIVLQDGYLNILEAEPYKGIIIHTTN
jgi:methionyl-tRNA formyltransferase